MNGLIAKGNGFLPFGCNEDFKFQISSRKILRGLFKFSKEEIVDTFYLKLILS